MSRKSWIVKASAEKIPLALGDGDEWIEVRSAISSGQKRRYLSAGLTGVRNVGTDDAPQQEIALDFAEVDSEKILVWVKDWSFIHYVNDKMETLPFTKENLDNLDPEAFDAIKSALDAYTEGKEREKKAPIATGGSRLKAISVSSETTPSSPSSSELTKSG